MSGLNGRTIFLAEHSPGMAVMTKSYSCPRMSFPEYLRSVYPRTGRVLTL